MNLTQALLARAIGQFERGQTLNLDGIRVDLNSDTMAGLTARFTQCLLKSGHSLEDLPESLRLAFFKQQLQGENTLNIWRQVTEVLGMRGIHHIPLKGIWIANQILENPAIRFLSDIDIWIEKRNLQKAKAVLKSIGFVETRFLHNRIHFHTTLHQIHSGQRLEVHTSLAHHDFTRIPSNAIWERSQFPLQGYRGDLHPEDLIVYTFQHAALHLFDRPERLLDLLDIDDWAKNQGTTPHSLVELSQKWQCLNLFNFSLSALNWMREIEENSYLFETFLRNQHKRAYWRMKLTDGPWQALRGLAHPKRLIGGWIA